MSLPISYTLHYSHYMMYACVKIISLVLTWSLKMAYIHWDSPQSEHCCEGFIKQSAHQASKSTLSDEHVATMEMTSQPPIDNVRAEDYASHTTVGQKPVPWWHLKITHYTAPEIVSWWSWPQHHKETYSLRFSKLTEDSWEPLHNKVWTEVFALVSGWPWTWVLRGGIISG